MLLISSAQPCSSNPVCLLLCGNLANRDLSSHTSERSETGFLELYCFIAIWELPSLKYFQNHSVSRGLSRHLQNTLQRPKNLFHHILHCLWQRTSCKVFQVNACLTLPLGKWTQTLPLWEKKNSACKLLCDSWTCADQETMLILSFLYTYSYTRI